MNDDDFEDEEWEVETDDDGDFDWDAYENERIQHEIDSIYEGTLRRVFG